MRLCISRDVREEKDKKELMKMEMKMKKTTGGEEGKGKRRRKSVLRHCRVRCLLIVRRCRRAMKCLCAWAKAFAAFTADQVKLVKAKGWSYAFKQWKSGTMSEARKYWSRYWSFVDV